MARIPSVTEDEMVVTEEGFSFPRHYKPRDIRFLEIAELGGWRIKLYGITQKGDRIHPNLMESAKRIVEKKLPRPAVGGGRYGIAVLMVHQGREGGFVILDSWVGENMLEHHAYYLAKPDFQEYRELRRDEPAFCVWEMEVIDFERRAWTKRVLANSQGPDLQAYLSACYNGEY